ncbi:MULTISPECIES: DUF6297 family protein [Pseudonocardia]|uniref:Uncharacterized protein n=2 Tax=Pseudonocardia TaxID=1847 RepID=A0A1Y2MXF7_PSEAH|nr:MULTISPECIES: DUF6297 family protein [Pseudonocardia]OSY39507.1 hypothetical protein BG845_03454 [Pseudonocardia autotrophica]TDN75255.1 hypothetical protein C8E95_4401 [Pseudonocardia autotrophica]BBF99200.1 hypothetical protein Pdca_04100 [Pseudonocardia autotrophica]GEC24746.1 hypothetical protein PSA01_17750 [Pseudonocardia saturnea]
MAGAIYEVVLTCAILGGVAYALIDDAFDQLTVPSPTVSAPLASVTGVALAAALFLMARAVGPLVADPARAGWLLPAPVDRIGLLARAVRTALVACAAGGAVGALVVSASAGWGLHPVILLAGSLVGLLVGQSALLVQARPRTAMRFSATARGLIAVSLVAAAAVVLGPAAVVDGAPAPPDPVVLAGTIVVLGVLCLLLAVPARSAPRRAGIPELTAGAPLLAAVWSAHLEQGLVSDVARDRRLRRRAPVRSMRLPGTRRRAFVTTSFLAVVRNRPALGWIAVGVLVPHIATVIVPPLLAPVVQLAGTTLAAFASAGALTVIARSPALRRALGGSDRALVLLHAVPPAAISVIVAALVAPVGGTVLSWLLLPVAALTIVLREVTRPEPALTATLLDTPFGTVPAEQIRDRLRGGTGTFAIAAVVLTIVG